MDNAVAKTDNQGITTYLNSEAVRKNIESVIGKDTDQFVSSLVSMVQQNPQLAQCTNTSLLTAALAGHALKLPGSGSMGFWYPVPFWSSKKKAYEAQFMLSYKGYLQLAIRSGQYKSLNVIDVRDGELKYYNPLTEEIDIQIIQDFNERQNAKIIGYFARFELVNGFVKSLYWTFEQMDAHARKYSKTYRKALDKGTTDAFWSSDFNGMAYKTMIRQLLSKWGIMSVTMQNAYENDYSTKDENGNIEYPDNVPDEPDVAVDVYADAEVIDDVVETEQTERPLEVSDETDG